MTRACLLVTDAVPSASGAPDWRRFCALAEHYRRSDFAVDGLVVAEGAIGADAAGWLRRTVDGPALTTFETATQAMRHITERCDHDVVHVGSPYLAPRLVAAPTGAMRIVDMQGHPVDPEGQRLSDADVDLLLKHTDLVVTADHEGSDFVARLGRAAVAAPFIRQADRLRRPVVRGGAFLAGLWVERSGLAIDAATAFFEAVRARGGGNAPRFAIAGPGAATIRPPPLPYPVSKMPDDMNERVFYRGLDLLMAPALSESTPRLDILSALEMGATPLVSTSALHGIKHDWRLPHFDDLPAMAEYVFERGRDMRAGGLLTELRARADWTWTSLSNAVARDRLRLNNRIKSHLDTRIQRKSA